MLSLTTQILRTCTFHDYPYNHGHIIAPTGNYTSRYTKYAAYPASITIPQGLVSCFFLKILTHKSTPAASEIIVSIIKLASKVMGIIKALVPSTNNMLKILLPTILPIAISALPFFAAVTDVTSSGREVPNATMVRPINFSLRPITSARAVALSTVMLLPQTTTTPPTIAAINNFHTQCHLVSSNFVKLRGKSSGLPLKNIFGNKFSIKLSNF